MNKIEKLTDSLLKKQRGDILTSIEFNEVTNKINELIDADNAAGDIINGLRTNGAFIVSDKTPVENINYDVTKHVQLVDSNNERILPNTKGEYVQVKLNGNVTNLQDAINKVNELIENGQSQVSPDDIEKIKSDIIYIIDDKDHDVLNNAKQYTDESIENSFNDIKKYIDEKILEGGSISEDALNELINNLKDDVKNDINEKITEYLSDYISLSYIRINDEIQRLSSDHRGLEFRLDASDIKLENIERERLNIGDDLDLKTDDTINAGLVKLELKIKNAISQNSNQFQGIQINDEYHKISEVNKDGDLIFRLDGSDIKIENIERARKDIEGDIVINDNDSLNHALAKLEKQIKTIQVGEIDFNAGKGIEIVDDQISLNVQEVPDKVFFDENGKLIINIPDVMGVDPSLLPKVVTKEYDGDTGNYNYNWNINIAGDLQEYIDNTVSLNNNNIKNEIGEWANNTFISEVDLNGYVKFEGKGEESALDESFL